MEIVTNGEVLGGEQPTPAKRRTPFLKSPGTRPTTKPRPRFPSATPHLSAARLELISPAWISHGPGAEAERKAVSVPAAKQFLLPPITRDKVRHFRPAPRRARNWNPFGRVPLGSGRLEIKACQRTTLCLPHPPLSSLARQRPSSRPPGFPRGAGG